MHINCLCYCDYCELIKMAPDTRNDKKFIKDCVAEALNDEKFIREFADKVTSRIEAFFTKKIDTLLSQMGEIKKQNKQIFTDLNENKIIIDSLNNKVSELENKNIKLTDDINSQNKILCEKNNSVQELINKCDALEQYTRRNTVRLIGAPRLPRDEVDEYTLGLLRDKLGMDVSSAAIDRCHPVGPPRDGKQDLLVKFVSYQFARSARKNSAKLRGTGLSIVEDLTKIRYSLYRSITSKLGAKNVWVFDGAIWTNINNKKTVFKTVAEFESYVSTTDTEIVL